MRISLCITTYNSVIRLQQVFKSLLQLVEKPAEILVCDDGSGPATRELVRWFDSRSKVPVYHLWQPDCGWRPSRARNNGIRHASGDYIVFLDGDCVPHRLFIKDHQDLATPGCLLLGDRAHVRESALNGFSPSFRDVLLAMFSGRIHKRSRAVRFAWERPVSHSFGSLDARALAQIAIGCNFAAWREDLLKVNGFNERITGWGLEDVELIARLMLSGIVARKVRNRAIVYHLDHGERDYDSQAVLAPVEWVFKTAEKATSVGIQRSEA